MTGARKALPAKASELSRRAALLRQPAKFYLQQITASQRPISI
jgi:hypothetical protein